MTYAITLLKSRWAAIAAAIALSTERQDVWNKALEDLLTEYGGAGRHYHDTVHIAALLALSQQYSGAIADQVAVDLAIFYHDAIYQPLKSDNEAKSAELARARLSALGLEAGLIDKVVGYVRATRHGSSPPAGRDLDLDHLLDFDLSILAAEPGAYADYSAAIRKEYRSVPDILYRPGRCKVLELFLAMPTIYRVGVLREQWERNARANLAFELGRLNT